MDHGVLDCEAREVIQKVPIEKIFHSTGMTKRTLECIHRELEAKKTDPYEYHLEEEVNYRLFINNLIEKCLDQVNLGVEESDILLNLAEYIVILTLEKSRFITKVNYLKIENQWLLEEVNYEKQRCLNLDEDVNLNEQLVQHYSKLHQMRTNQVVMVEKVIVVDNEKLDLGLDIPRHMKGIFKLIIAYISQGRYEIALSLINHSIQDIREQRKTNTYDYAIMLHIHAILLRDMGCLKEATTSLEETLRVLYNQPTKNNEHIVTTLNNLSVLYGRRGNFKAAEPLCRKALQIRLEELGEHHPDVGKQLNNLALILQNIKLSPEIEQLYMRAIDIYDKSLEKCIVHKVKTKNNLACFYIKSKDFTQAERCLKEIITEFHANSQVVGRVKRCLWEIIEDCVSTNVAPQLHVNQFARIGTFPDSSYKNTYRYLITVYRRTQRLKEADMVEDYLEWCTKANIQQNAQPVGLGRIRIENLGNCDPNAATTNAKLQKKGTSDSTSTKKRTGSAAPSKGKHQDSTESRSTMSDSTDKGNKSLSSKFQKGLSRMFKK